jgi:phenylacetate-CoA ligase
MTSLLSRDLLANVLTRQDLERLQLERLRALLSEVLPANRFYARKFAAAGLSTADFHGLADLSRLPFTTKAELLADQEANPPFGSNLTYPLARYCRYHQTSGTKGRPLRWLDTLESWDGMLRCWETIFDIAGVTAADRLFFAFSFGPFLGFWTAFEAGTRRGCLCLPGGGMTSAGRLQFLLDNEATVLFCTPTYALRLAEVAQQQGIPLGISTAGCAIRAIIVAGEPGGSVPATRARIEQAWHARVFDHAGLTEVGPVAVECPDSPTGLHLLEADYIAEVIDPATGQALPSGQPGDLVLTNLGRWGSPVIRYRTGDLVRLDRRPCPCGRVFVRLDGGILGRTDDMIHVRGNNVYPSALEAVIRRFDEVAEYRVRVRDASHLAALRIEVEPRTAEAGDDVAERVSEAIRQELHFRAEVSAVAPGTLPRFELKARRIVHGHDENIPGADPAKPSGLLNAEGLPSFPDCLQRD